MRSSLLLACAALAAACLCSGSAGGGVPLRAALQPRSPQATAAPRAAAALRGSPSVTIAIVDSGVEPLPSLAPSLAPGVDLVDGDSTPQDGNGHGTAMAAIAAGLPSSSVTGVCSGCRLLPVRVVGNGGTGSTSTAAEGVRWAVAHGARVVNLSLTSPADDPALDSAIRDAVAAGVVVVAAAGNSGSSDPAANGYPAAAAAGAIGVAAADPQSRLYPWSNHGSWVRLAAPGELPALKLDGSAFVAAGTSASAAYVSGAAGLVLSVNPGLSPAAVEQLLVRTGDPAPGLDVADRRIVDPAAAAAAARMG